jgi:hypothetical protein
MACGTPVIAARAGSIPEVAGDAAAFFDPEDSEELRNALERIVFDPAACGALIEAGKRRQSEFTWEACCRRHREACLLACPSWPRPDRHRPVRPPKGSELSKKPLVGIAH